MYSANILYIFLFGLSVTQAAVNTKATNVEDRTEFAYQASVQTIDDKQHICSASLLDNRNLITYATCLYDIDTSSTSLFSLKEAEDLQVVLGVLDLGETDNRITTNVKYIFTHEDFIPYMGRYDMAVIRLSEEVELTDNIKTIAISTSTPAANTECVISGWDTSTTSTSANVLQSTSFSTIAQSGCVELTNTSYFCGETIEEECPKEKGSPVVCNGALAGILGFEDSCLSSPNSITDLSQFRTWITEQQERSDSTNLMNSIYLTSLCISAWLYTYKFF